jgi:hypothetical protein
LIDNKFDFDNMARNLFYIMYPVYNSTDFLTFLNTRGLKVIVSFETVPKGAMHFAQIEGCYLEPSIHTSAKAHGISLDDALRRLAKLIAGKKIAKITTCPPPRNSPEPIEIPVGFGRTEKDIIRT